MPLHVEHAGQHHQSPDDLLRGGYHAVKGQRDQHPEHRHHVLPQRAGADAQAAHPDVPADGRQGRAEHRRDRQVGERVRRRMEVRRADQAGTTSQSPEQQQPRNRAQCTQEGAAQLRDLSGEPALRQHRIDGPAGNRQHDQQFAAAQAQPLAACGARSRRAAVDGDARTQDRQRGGTPEAPFQSSAHPEPGHDRHVHRRAGDDRRGGDRIRQVQAQGEQHQEAADQQAEQPDTHQRNRRSQGGGALGDEQPDGQQGRRDQVAGRRHPERVEVLQQLAGQRNVQAPEHAGEQVGERAGQHARRRTLHDDCAAQAPRKTGLRFSAKALRPSL